MTCQKYVVYPAHLVHDFTPEVGRFRIRNMSLGPYGEICVLAINRDPVRSEQTSLGGGKKDYIYKVIRKSEKSLQSTRLRIRHGHLHFYQPLASDYALLVCGRSQLYNSGQYDLNAKVFDNRGQLIREFLLGDGIQDIKVTQNSFIWTSYFDEGIFGNCGWNNPVGADGLILWDQYGSRQYVYDQPAEHLIDDCYAMNVVSDKEMWFYFYAKFKLAHFFHGQIEYTPVPVYGADGFVVYRDYFLFRGGYEDQNQYMLLEKQANEHIQPIAQVSFVDNRGKSLKSNWVDCRGSTLLIQKKEATYLVDLKEVVHAI